MTDLRVKLGHIATKQDGLVTREQCRGSGATLSWLKARCDSGEWSRLYRGVFKCSSGAPTYAQRCRAALLAVGPPAVISHQSASRLWGLRCAGDEHVHLTTGMDRRVDVAGITAHRTRNLGDHEYLNRSGLKMTSLPRTTLDLAGRADDFTLRALVDKTLRSNEYQFEVLEAGAHEGLRLEGAARVRALLAENDEPADSVVESYMNELALYLGAPGIRHFEIPLPGFKAHPDIVWPDLKLIVEVDSVRYHGTPQAMARDRERDRELQLVGYLLARFMARELLSPRDRERTVIKLSHLIAKRASTRSLGVREPSERYEQRAEQVVETSRTANAPPEPRAPTSDDSVRPDA